MDTENINTTRDFMGAGFGYGKMDKSTELNAEMSITNNGRDAYESKIHQIGGGE